MIDVDDVEDVSDAVLLRLEMLLDYCAENMGRYGLRLHLCDLIEYFKQRIFTHDFLDSLLRDVCDWVALRLEEQVKNELW